MSYGNDDSNYWYGFQVIEVVVDDPDISDISVAQVEPTVWVEGQKINMVQATDGKWYAYIANISHVKKVDSLVVSQGKGLDFGEFCSSSTDTSVLGMDVS